MQKAEWEDAIVASLQDVQQAREIPDLTDRPRDRCPCCSEVGVLDSLGRTSQIINVGGSKVYPAVVESVLPKMDSVADATVSARLNAITGQVVAARIALREAADPAVVRKDVRAFCRSRLAAFKVPVVIELTDEALHSARLKKKRNL